MEKKDPIQVHDQQASQYEQQVRDYRWFGHDILFGMCFEYANSGECLLDIGIGTGLSSQLFARLGLYIYGIDGSKEMLNICRSKGFTKELKQFDLRNDFLPYSDGFFHHVISCGVFHLLGDLSPLFKEVSRVIKPDGIFAFTTYSEGTEEGNDGYSEGSAYGVSVYTHNDGYIKRILGDYGFDVLKYLEFLTLDDHGRDDLLCRIYVARKSK
jgi:predicted TPR repeat methyltransferase